MSKTSRDEMRNIIVLKIAELLEIDKEEVDPDEEFMDMGIESVEAMSVFVTIQKQSGIVISPMIMFECVTINQICDYLSTKELIAN